MKYIKAYEYINPMLDDLKRLLSHLINIFNEFGYDYKNYFSDFQYESDFFKRNIVERGIPSLSKRSFDLKGDFSSTLIFLSVVLRIGSVDDKLVRFIPEYFKTITGLRLYGVDEAFYETTFRIDNVDEIIKQVSKEDFELKFKAKKYNL